MDQWDCILEWSFTAFTKQCIKILTESNKISSMSFIMKKEDGTLWDYTFKLELRKISSSVKRMNVCLRNCALISESLLNYEGNLIHYWPSKDVHWPHFSTPRQIIYSSLGIFSRQAVFVLFEYCYCSLYMGLGTITAHSCDSVLCTIAGHRHRGN